MKAPDVAITEASVGAGLTTAIFLLSLRKLKRDDVE
nr:hydrogenase subunit MbhD domain-containing protein [Mesotoga infera]